MLCVGIARGIRNRRCLRKDLAQLGCEEGELILKMWRSLEDVSHHIDEVLALVSFARIWACAGWDKLDVHFVDVACCAYDANFFFRDEIASASFAADDDHAVERIRLCFVFFWNAPSGARTYRCVSARKSFCWNVCGACFLKIRRRFSGASALGFLAAAPFLGSGFEVVVSTVVFSTLAGAIGSSGIMGTTGTTSGSDEAIAEIPFLTGGDFRLTPVALDLVTLEGLVFIVAFFFFGAVFVLEVLVFEFAVATAASASRASALASM